MVTIMEPNWSIFTLLQVITLWLVVGFFVITSNLNIKNPLSKGILITFVFHIPWIFNFIDIGYSHLLLPLTILIILFGSTIGYLTNKFK